MSWAGMLSTASPYNIRMASRMLVLMAVVDRLQEKCEPGNHPGHDEDWYVFPLDSALRYFPLRPSCCTSKEAPSADQNIQVTLRRQMIATTRWKSGMAHLQQTSPEHLPHQADHLWGSRFRTMETASLRLQKEAKGYLDSLRGP